MITQEIVWQKIDKATTPFTGYKEALNILSTTLPLGYSLYFALHYVNADLLNGGISQLNSNPTWSLILTAIKACQQASAPKIEYLLKEIVLYYYQRGRSRLKKEIPDGFFDGFDQPLAKSLTELEDEYYAQDKNVENVLTMLRSDESLW